MRKILFVLAAAALGALSTVGTASAGHAHKHKHVVQTYVCWTAVAGHTDCDWLPPRYFVPGVTKPTCCDVRHHDTDRTEFVLTKRIIRALAHQGVRVDTMAPGAWAQLQAVCKKDEHHH